MVIMKYKIPLLSSVMMSTTACFTTDPIVGEWTLSSSDELCMEYSKSYSYDGYNASYSTQICLDFDAIRMSVENIKDAGLQSTILEQSGTVSMSYAFESPDESYSESYTYDMIQGDALDIELIEESDNSYRMSMEMGVLDPELEDDETVDMVDLEFNCTLSESSMECEFTSVDFGDEDSDADEDYYENLNFSGTLTFGK
jgi:hypothetical protein